MVDTSKDVGALNADLTMKLVMSEDRDKVYSLFQLLCSLNSESALIFCNHRDACERTSEYLNDKGVHAIFYHGGMEQDDRERALIQFRNGSVNYLVTTDLAARVGCYDIGTWLVELADALFLKPEVVVPQSTSTPNLIDLPESGISLL